MTVLFTFVLTIFNTVFRGYLVKTLWGWFVMPLFPSLPHITVPIGIGLVYFVSGISIWRHFTASELQFYSEEYKGVSIQLLNQFAATFAIVSSLFAGWFVHRFLM